MTSIYRLISQYIPSQLTREFRILLFLSTAVHAVLFFCVLFSLLLFRYLLLGILSCRKRKERGENEAEKKIITWTAVHRNCKIWDYRLWCQHFSQQRVWQLAIKCLCIMHNAYVCLDQNQIRLSKLPESRSDYD